MVRITSANPVQLNIVVSDPVDTSRIRLQEFARASIHYVNTMTTGLYSDEDIDQARATYEQARRRLSVQDLRGAA